MTDVKKSEKASGQQLLITRPSRPVSDICAKNIMSYEEYKDEESALFVEGAASKMEMLPSSPYITGEELRRSSIPRNLGDLRHTHEDEYTKLYLRFQCALIEHTLAHQYYEFRSYYLVYLPVTLIATFLTIIGFLISGTAQNDDKTTGKLKLRQIRWVRLSLY